MAQKIERKIETIGLFGVDIERDAGRLRRFGEREQARGDFAPAAGASSIFVARRERRQFDRDVGRRRVAVAAVGGEGGYRARVIVEIARRIFGGHGRFAEHIERMREAALARGGGARAGGFDGLAQHELPPQRIDGAAGANADHRRAEAVDKRAQSAENVGGGFRAHDFARQQKSPSRGVDERRRAFAEPPRPFAGGDFVADELVGGRGVGDARQRLGEAEQGDSFARRQSVFGQKRFDRAWVFGGAQFACERKGDCADFVLAIVGPSGGGQNTRGNRRFGFELRRAHRCARFGDGLPHIAAIVNHSRAPPPCYICALYFDEKYRR